MCFWFLFSLVCVRVRFHWGCFACGWGFGGGFFFFFGGGVGDLKKKIHYEQSYNSETTILIHRGLQNEQTCHISFH